MNVLRILKNIGICLACAFFAGCTYASQGFPDEDRGALPNAHDNFGYKTTSIVYPEQNWDASDSLWFYNTSQGSNLMDYEIFLNLELANSDMLFRSNENLWRYRYLLQKATRDNEKALPVGWVKDSYNGKDFIGFTCAACHTTQVNYNGRGIRIDGGPAMTDVGTMLDDLEKTLKASLPDSLDAALAAHSSSASSTDKKFYGLADRILKDDRLDREKRTSLYERLVHDYKKIHGYNQIDQPPTITRDGVKYNFVRYGYARLDAFGRIFNRAIFHLDSSHGGRPANAPVSYPYLWDTPQHDFVQWNGIADNGTAAGLGPLGRNTGEVIGVFASVEVIKEDPSWLWKLLVSGKPTYSYPSSARTLNQVRLEDHLNDLWSPSWEQLAAKGFLPVIDKEKVKLGKEVFDFYKCASCHSDLDRKDKNRLVVAQFANVDLIGTDPTMASNALTYCGRNDTLQNLGFDMCPGELDNAQGVTGKSAMTEITTGVMTEGILRKIWPFLQAIWSNPWRNIETQRHVDFEVANKGYLYAYKARPLNGIWATAPFLHNGSVPNLYELFLPSSCAKGRIPGKTCRSKTFTVGNRELDTRGVGFVQEDDPNKRDPGLFVFDTSLKGNSNRGHEYAVGVTPIIKTKNGKAIRKSDGQFDVKSFKDSPIHHNDRMALIEYLKTL